jgi:hypothetical protein
MICLLLAAQGGMLEPTELLRAKVICRHRLGLQAESFLPWQSDNYPDTSVPVELVDTEDIVAANVRDVEGALPPQLRRVYANVYIGRRALGRLSPIYTTADMDLSLVRIENLSAWLIGVLASSQLTINDVATLDFTGSALYGKPPRFYAYRECLHSFAADDNDLRVITELVREMPVCSVIVLDRTRLGSTGYGAVGLRALAAVRHVRFISLRWTPLSASDAFITALTPELATKLVWCPGARVWGVNNLGYFGPLHRDLVIRVREAHSGYYCLPRVDVASVAPQQSVAPSSDVIVPTGEMCFTTTRTALSSPSLSCSTVSIRYTFHE